MGFQSPLSGAQGSGGRWKWPCSFLQKAISTSFVQTATPRHMASLRLLEVPVRWSRVRTSVRVRPRPLSDQAPSNLTQ